MKLKSRYWSDLGTRDFQALAAAPDAAGVVALLPLGATEQHGPHLPTGVDTTLVDAVVGAALARLDENLPVLVLPTQAVGYSPEHGAYPGTLTLGAETVIRLWSELGAGVARAGVAKLLLFNAHGGQVSLMDVVARELRSRHGLMVYSSSWYSLPLAGAVLAAFDAHEHRFGVHAGAIETSMMLAARPQHVDMAQARDFASSAEQRAQHYPILGNGKSAKLGWQMQDYNPAGAVGNAAGATAQQGAALIASAAEQLALLLQEISSLPLSTLAAGALPPG